MFYCFVSTLLDFLMFGTMQMCDCIFGTFYTKKESKTALFKLSSYFKF